MRIFLAAAVLCLIAAVPLAAAGVRQATLLWKFRTNGDVLSLAIGRTRVAYASTSTGTDIYALASDGKLVRKLATPKPVSKLIAAADGTIYARSTNGDVYAFRSDGVLKWKGSRISSALAVGSDGTLYAGCSQLLGLCAFAADGTLKWKFARGFEFTSLTIGSDGTLYGSGGNGIYAFAPSGAVKWNFSPSSYYSWLAVSSRGTVYAVANNDIYVFARDGGLRSKTQPKTPFGVVNDRHMTERDGVIYSGSYDIRRVRDSATGARRFAGPPAGHSRYRVVAVDSHRGSLIWSFDRLGGKIFALMVGRDGTIDVGSYDGHIYALDPGTGALKWKFWAGGGWGKMPIRALAVREDGTICAGAGSFVEAIRPP